MAETLPQTLSPDVVVAAVPPAAILDPSQQGFSDGDASADKAWRRGDSEITLSDFDTTNPGDSVAAENDGATSGTEDETTWGDISNRQLGVVLEKSYTILADPEATSDQKAEAARVYGEAKGEHLIRVDMAVGEAAVGTPVEVGLQEPDNAVNVQPAPEAADRPVSEMDERRVAFEAKLAAMKDRELTAEQLTARSGIPAEVNTRYGEMLRAANEGRLDFDPVKNAIDFAAAADSVDKVTGIGDIKIDIENGESAGNLSEDTALKLAQQERFARSLGFDVVGEPHVEDGVLKLSIQRPLQGDVEQGKLLKDGTLDIDGTRPDRDGTPVDPKVIETRRAGNYLINGHYEFKNDAGEHFKEITVGEAVDTILRSAESTGVIPLGYTFAFAGAASFYKNVAEALGYKVEVTNGEHSQTLVRLTGKRPGFETPGDAR